MDNEKILAAARKNKNRGKEYENKESTRSGIMGTLMALIVGTGLFLIEYFVMNSVNVGMIAVGMTACGVQSLYEGIKLRKNYLTVIGVVQSIIAIISIIVFIVQVVKL